MYQTKAYLEILYFYLEVKQAEMCMKATEHFVSEIIQAMILETKPSQSFPFGC